MDKQEEDAQVGVHDDVEKTSSVTETGDRELEEKSDNSRKDVKSSDESKETEPILRDPEAEVKSDAAGADSKCGGEEIRFNTSLKEAEEFFYYFWKEHSPFSQWYASKFTIKDQEFCCAEQYMMYTKAVLQHDDDMAEKILKNGDPRTIKGLGRKASQYCPDLWYNNCLHVVKDGNRAKFQQNEKLKESLLNTYPKVLVEASPYDKRWGIGFSKHQESAWNEVTWDGLNLLGYILTELRDELLYEASIIPFKDRKIYFDELTKKLQESLNEDEGYTTPQKRMQPHRHKNHGDGRRHDDYRRDRGQPHVSSDVHPANKESSSSTAPNAWMKERWMEDSEEKVDNRVDREQEAASPRNVAENIQDDSCETYIEDNAETVETKISNIDFEELKLI